MSQTIRVPIDSVIVAGIHRESDPEMVTSLAQSMSTIGLKTPITIRVRKTELSPDRTHTEHLLVAGRHRLEAAKSLGWTEIDTFVLDGDDTDARLWEIAENLHRKELNDLERSVYIAEWFELAKRQFGQVVQKPEGGRPEGGIAEAARLLPVPGKTEDGKRKTIERALKIAAITPEAKEAAAAAGLADNQHALLGVAGEKTKEEQLKKVAKLASRKRAKRKKTPAVRVETPATAPSADLPSFRTSEQETEATISIRTT